MSERKMTFLLIHGENLMFFVVAMYALAVLGWTALCYLIINLWQSRKKKKSMPDAKYAAVKTNEVNSRK